MNLDLWTALLHLEDSLSMSVQGFVVETHGISPTVDDGKLKWYFKFFFVFQSYEIIRSSYTCCGLADNIILDDYCEASSSANSTVI